MWEVRKNILQQLNASITLKEARRREEIPLLNREVGTVQHCGETNRFGLVAARCYNLAKIRRLKKARKLWKKMP